MKYEGMIYRPPVEANDILLQVAVGCTHNQCTFCNMFKEKKFHLVDEQTLTDNLKEASRFYSRADRVFLVDGDAFALSADRLEHIAKLIHHYLPNCKTITMYAAVRNIETKTDEQLVRLRELGINDLYVGIESGIAAAKLANQTKPFLIIPTTLGIFKGTELFKKAQRGEFTEAGEKENLQEQKAFLEHADLPETYYWSAHALNSTPVVGFLNVNEKGEMLRKLEASIQAVDDDLFTQKFKRTSL